MWGGPDSGAPGVSSEDRKDVAPVDPWAGPGRLLLSALFFAAVLLLTFVTAELPGRTQLTVVWLSTGVQLGILLLVPDHLRIRYGVVFGVTGIAVASAGWAPVPSWRSCSRWSAGTGPGSTGTPIGCGHGCGSPARCWWPRSRRRCWVRRP